MEVQKTLVLQLQFIEQGDFRGQFGPGNMLHEHSAVTRSQPNMNDRLPYLATRSCNSRALPEGVAAVRRG